MATVKPIPDGYHTITPYLLTTDAAALLDFLKRGFGAQEFFVHKTPDGRISHAEAKIGDSMIMMGEPPDKKAMPSSIYLYVPDVDATYRSATTAGAQTITAPKDQFYGDRTATIKDSLGNLWYIGTHIEDVTPEEMARRAQQQAQQAQV